MFFTGDDDEFEDWHLQVNVGSDALKHVVLSRRCLLQEHYERKLF